ncbi:hypothetical protein PSMK_09240 [Phycisphaera mikurensis NBRC 102666]|uniref:Uncharacterized protein n=1 Tax=Phycisphaera mikurensis (strain NBRC 102666 / KCTC 22515 / FYK2301M01) TaxID=1142394 RepID=I0ICU5_PHYMF|nr:hypothetical protein PSMK_09240 [Phycisphaera mikurensis NBRC 102666]
MGSACRPERAGDALPLPLGLARACGRRAQAAAASDPAAAGRHPRLGSTPAGPTRRAGTGSVGGRW